MERHIPALTLFAIIFQVQNHLAFARAEDKRSAVSLGIRMHDGRMSVLLARNTALPAKVSKMFTNGGAVEILAGEHAVAKDNYRMGLLQLPVGPEGNSNSVRLSFEIDLSGLLTATVEEDQTGRSVTQTFESFRDIQNVLASVESRGSWSVLTALADKSKSGGQRDLLAQLQSLASTPESQEPVEVSGRAASGRSSWLIEVLTVAGVAAVLALGMFGFSTLYPGSLSKPESSCNSQLKVADAALATQMEKSEEEKLSREKLAMELRVARLLIAQQREELETCQQLTADLPFIVYDDDGDESENESTPSSQGQSPSNAISRMRFVKIQCPGVKHRDIEIEIVVNGVVVKIARDQSPGMNSLKWTKRFQFPQVEGHFEFKEEEVRLQLGILLLPFKSYTPQPRVFRLPQHQAFARTVEAAVSGSLSEVSAEGSVHWVLAASHSCPPIDESVFAPFPQASMVSCLQDSIATGGGTQSSAPCLSILPAGSASAGGSPCSQDRSPVQEMPAAFSGRLSALPTESSRSHSCGQSSQDATSERSSPPGHAFASVIEPGC